MNGCWQRSTVIFMVIISVIVKLRFNALFNASVLQMLFHVSFHVNNKLTNHDFVIKFNFLNLLSLIQSQSHIRKFAIVFCIVLLMFFAKRIVEEEGD